MIIINLPGIGNSGELHWQTRWEQLGLVQRRFQPGSWDQPQLHDWIDALEKAIAVCSEPPMLVAHSLSCLLVAHWAATSEQRIRGAMLVAVPDTSSAAFPTAATSFTGVPEMPLPFPTLIVASSNDPYATTTYANQRAQQWQTGMVEAGAYGHLNAASGLGEWYLGQSLLTAFMTGLGQPFSIHENNQSVVR